MIGLVQLLAEVESSAEPAATAELELNGLVEDSRKVVAGNGYVAVQGATHDGHKFAPQAVAQGAVVVLAERRIADLAVPVHVVTDLRSQRSALAAKAYGDPSRALNCTAVTGTNGKTSVAHYLAQLLTLLAPAASTAQRAAHEPACGYMGTLGWGLVDDLAEATLTTGDACSVQQRLAALHKRGCQRVAMEVSSHALDQDRVAAVRFRSALFTNLSRDHLDYHGTMEVYAAAKRSLFDFDSLQRVVTNIDDACGRDIGRALQGKKTRVYTYGSGSGPNNETKSGEHNDRERDAGASVSWRDIQVQPLGFTGQWCTAWGNAPLDLPLLGRFAIANVAAAVTLLLSEGYPLATVAEACRQLRSVPGRMQYFANSDGAAVVVDFAHTPDALRQAAQSLREHCSGALHIVFGCGGDRDRGKRAQMGHAAAQNADRLWLTDDNPRSEDPQQIVADIVSGLRGLQPHYDVQHDRRQAITQALASAGSQDVVLVAGKGHETYQERHGQRTAYSDVQTVLALLAARGGCS